MSRLIAEAGPFTAVREVSDAPLGQWTQQLWVGVNGYFRNAAEGSSWIARPGFTNTNPGAQIGAGQRMQGTHAHIDPTTQTIYRFFVVNGKLHRSDSAFATFTDVSPAGITIDTATTTRVSFLSVGTSLVVSDGVNRPWVMSNFGATPVTGTYIDIDGASGAWSAWGRPAVYEDSVFFITQTVPGGSLVTPRVGIVWSEPNQPTIGYTQTGYADFWNIIENGTEPLFAMLGTNNGLFYWRANSIGLVAGTPSLSFSTTATRDARGDSVGSVSPWAIGLIGSNIFFPDSRGRAWMMPLDGEPQPIWKQAADATIDPAANDPVSMAYLAVGAIVPDLDHYLVAPWSANLTTTPKESPIYMYAFDGRTGAYAGRWSVGPDIGLDVLDTQLDANGVRVLCVGGGGLFSEGSGGYVWILNAVANNATSSEGTVARFFTGPLGNSANRVLYPDYAVLVFRSAASVTVTVQTASSSLNLGTVVPNPHASINIGYRALVGLDGAATRGVEFDVVKGSDPSGTQWGIERIEVYGSVSAAGPEEQ